MAYEIIQPPFTLKFQEMPQKELRAYYQWFLGVIPARTAELTSAVNGTAGFELWQPDLSPESLNPLGAWFAAQVEQRATTPGERQEFTESAAIPIPAPTEALTNRTISLAMDVGMYMSQVFLRNHPSLRWKHGLGGKRSVDYGQPVLAGFGPMVFNPVRMCVTQAHGIVGGRHTGHGLRELYEIWTGMIG